MRKNVTRSIVRWIHLSLSIPVLGYIYGKPADVQQYANGVRFIFFPAIVLTGLWMWKGHFASTLFFRKPPKSL